MTEIAGPAPAEVLHPNLQLEAVLGKRTEAFDTMNMSSLGNEKIKRPFNIRGKAQEAFYAKELSSLGVPEKRGLFRGIASAAGKEAKKTGKRLGFIAKHPIIIPKAAGLGLKHYGENVFHPLLTLRNLRHPSRVFTAKELAFYTGATAGYVDTLILYNALPPGMARLVKSGLTFALAQTPNIALNIARRHNNRQFQEHNINNPQEELSRKTKFYRKAAEYLGEFLKAHSTAAGFAMLFTTSGLAEKGIEAILKTAGISEEQIVHGAQVFLNGGVDQEALEIAAHADQVVNSEAYKEVFDNIARTPEYRTLLSSFTSQNLQDATDAAGIKFEPGSVEHNKAWDYLSKQHSLWAEAKFNEGAKAALLANPELSPQDAAKAGEAYVYAYMEKFPESPIYQKWIEADKEMFTRIANQKQK